MPRTVIINVSDSDKMETPPVSVLQLEIEELKENMNSVQSEIVTCLASLSLQHDRICDVVNRLECVSAIVRAITMINDDKDNPKLACSSRVLPSGNLCSEDDTAMAITANAITDHHLVQPYMAEVKLVSLDASSKKINSEEVNPLASGVLAVKKSEELFTPSPVKDDNISELKGEYDSVAAKDSDGIVNKTVNKSVSTIRPRLTKNCKANCKEISRDETIPKIATPSPVLCSTKMSFPSSLTSGQAATSVMITVKKVKEFCETHGWILEGCHSTRANKKSSAIVHFYKVSVKMSKEDKVARGVGGNKVEAVKRAFKSMELALSEAINEDRSKVGSKNVSSSGLDDNIVNFDEDSLLPCKLYAASSEDSLSLSNPPVFHAQGLKDYSTSIQSCPERVATGDDIVLQRLTLSDNDAARLLGFKGRRINQLEKSSEVKISVLGMPGNRDRPVKLRGKQHQVNEALKIIHSIISS